jgi:prevent-host-death family protein
MAVSIRELARNASGVVNDVTTNKRAALITKHGKTVAAVVPIDEADLEDFVLSQLPGLAEELATAQAAHRAGKTIPLSELVSELDAQDKAATRDR